MKEDLQADSIQLSTVDRSVNTAEHGALINSELVGTDLASFDVLACINEHPSSLQGDDLNIGYEFDGSERCHHKDESPSRLAIRQAERCENKSDQSLNQRNNKPATDDGTVDPFLGMAPEDGVCRTSSGPTPGNSERGYYQSGVRR